MISKDVAKAHNINLQENATTTITQVVEVTSFTDKQIWLKLKEKSLQITGAELVILRLDTNDEVVEIEGKIAQIKYTATHITQNFFKKLLK
ncbi:MAG: YabP/YqfC family sporulation protein [Clostridia bacterium]